MIGTHTGHNNVVDPSRRSTDLLRRTIVRLLLTYVGPLILLTVYFLVQSRDLTNESRRRHLVSQAEHQAHILDLFLRERVVNLRNLIGSPAMEEASCDELADRFLSDLEDDSDAFVDIGFFDDSGVQTCYAGPYQSLEKRDYSSEDWYVLLRSEPGSHVITDSYLGFRGRPHFTIAVSRIVEGKFTVLRTALDPERIYEYITSAIGPSDVHISIVDADGFFQIVTPNIGAPLEESSIMPPASPPMGVGQVAVEDRVHEFGYSWLETAGWALITQMRAGEDRELLAGNEKRIALISALIIVVITIVIVFRARVIVRLQEETVETKKQLVHAAKLASVGELAAGIAHEINNPLAIISEEAGLMKDVLDPKYGVNYTSEQLVERLDEIHKAVFRCRDITRKLLAFVRTDDVKPERQDMNHFLNGILDGFLTRRMESSNISVVRSLDPDLDAIVTDAMQFEQVFLNIINNAVDALGDRRGTITVATSQDEDHVLVSVADTGPGMDADTLSKVFLPFFTTKEVGKGTGLGLSVSASIIEGLGGKISVESEVGNGSTFTISLPKADVWIRHGHRPGPRR